MFFRVISLYRPVAAAMLLAFVGFAAPAMASTCSGSVSSTINQSINARSPNQELFNAAIIHYMNAERCRRGLTPLAADGRLLSAATAHSRNMAADRNFSHKSHRAGMQTMSQRLKGVGIRAATAGENIAMDKLFAILNRPISTKTAGNCQFFYVGGEPVPMHSYKTLAKQVVARLMSSSKHRNNILNPRFVRGGNGLGIDPKGSACGDVYITQDFAS